MGKRAKRMFRWFSRKIDTGEPDKSNDSREIDRKEGGDKKE